MSFCMGFVYGHSVYLIADSAVTRFMAQTEDTVSTFGEVSRSNPDASVSEGAVKITALGPNCMVAMAADDLARAQEAIVFMRAVYDQTTSVPDLLSYVAKSFDLSTPPHFGFLIAISTSTGPELWQWSSESNEPISVETWSHIGTMDGWPLLATEKITEIIRGRATEDQIGVIITAVVQSFAFHAAKFGDGIGGVYSGVRVSSAGVEWNGDTNYFVHRQTKAAPFAIVNVYWRENGVLIYSSFTDKTSIYLTDLGGLSNDEWCRRWLDGLQRRLARSKARYWIFFDLEAFTAIVIDAGRNTSSIPVVSSTFDGKWSRLTFSPILIEALAIPVPPSSDEVLPSTSIGYFYEEDCVLALQGMAAARRGEPTNLLVPG